MKKLFLVLMVLALSSGVAQQEMGVLYDPKIPVAILNIPTAQKQKIVAQAIQFGFSIIKKSCVKFSEQDGKSAILEARMTGSFTRPKSQQMAYVLSIPCGTLYNGDNWRVVAVYEGALLKSAYLVTYTVMFGGIKEFYAVKDINQNGLSEIAIIGSSGDGGGYETSLDLIDWNANTPKPLGHLTVSSFMYDEGSGKSDGHQYTIYVAKNPQPVFVGLEGGSKTQLTLLQLEKPNVLVISIR